MSRQTVCLQNASLLEQKNFSKFPRHSPLVTRAGSSNRKQNLFRRLRHWWNFFTSLVELFCRKSSETLGFCLFPHISKHLWTEWVAYLFFSKWFEPRSISSSCSVIVRVSVVLKRTVGDSDWRFDNLSGRHLQSHCDNVPSVDGIYFFSANFTSISENWLWPLEYHFKIFMSL